MRVDGSPQWRVIGGCMVAQFVCDTKPRSSSVGFCQLAFECWADGRPEQNRFSAVGTVADDWTVKRAATNAFAAVSGVFVPTVEWSEAWSSYATITETTIVHIGGRILDEPTVSGHPFVAAKRTVTAPTALLYHLCTVVRVTYLPTLVTPLSSAARVFAVIFFGPISTDIPEIL